MYGLVGGLVGGLMDRVVGGWMVWWIDGLCDLEEMVEWSGWMMYGWMCVE